MPAYCPHCGARLSPGPGAVCDVCRIVADGPSDQHPSDAQTAADQKKAYRNAVVISGIMYAVAIGTLFAPDVQAKAVEAFGPSRLGLPAVVFAGGLMTLLFVPFPWTFYHLALGRVDRIS